MKFYDGMKLLYLETDKSRVALKSWPTMNRRRWKLS